MSTPFLVMGLPRSRTHWLSHFLGYGDYKCGHEQAMYMRSVADLKSWLSQDWTGSSETAVSPGWRLIRHYRPDLKVLIVRRPVEEVVDSLMRIDLSGIATYGRDRVETGMRYLDRMLDQAEAEMGNVLTVRFHELENEETCASAFEHCLPYKFDNAWYEIFKPMNLQINTRALMRYRLAHRVQIDGFKSACRSELRRLREAGEIHR